MISNDIYYKIHNVKLSAIIKIFNTWKHYLEERKHELIVLIDQNNL